MRFRTAKSLRRARVKLPADQQRAARTAFEIFRQDPFDARLRTHKIHRLSAAYGKTIYAVCIEADLRAVFYIEKQTVWTVDIGTHAIYRS